MAHKNKILQSINLSGASICVDIFQRPDDSFGFDEFRRDPEDPSGWYSIGHYGDRAFQSEKEAFDAALVQIHWLTESI